MTMTARRKQRWRFTIVVVLALVVVVLLLSDTVKATKDSTKKQRRKLFQGEPPSSNGIRNSANEYYWQQCDDAIQHPLLPPNDDDNDRRRHHRKLGSKRQSIQRLQSCPASRSLETAFYNYNVDLTLSEGSRCNDDDMFIIGALLSETLKEIECSIPNYKEEVFYGELCEVPSHTLQSLVDNGRNLHGGRSSSTRNLMGRRRRLPDEQQDTSFTYHGMGHCTICGETTDDRRQRRRRLSHSSKDSEAESESSSNMKLVESTCVHAARANLGVRMASNALEEATRSYMEVIDLASTFYDASKGTNLVEDVEKKLHQCQEHEEMARLEAGMTQHWCDEAQQRAARQDDGDDNDDKHTLQHFARQAEKRVDEVKDETKKSMEALHKVRKVKVKIIKDEIKYKADQKEKDVKELTAKMKEDVDEQVDELKDLIRETKEATKKEKDQSKKKVLEQQIESLEADVEQLEKETKETKEILENEVKMDEKLQLLMVDLEHVGDMDEWLKKFSDISEIRIPRMLVKFYNTSGVGCLVENEYPDAKVDAWQVSQESGLAVLDDCELNFLI